VVDGDWTGPVTTAKIRVWADDDYRAQHVHWQQAFAEQLDYANAVLAAQFGVRLEPDYREWPRHAVGVALADSLAELATEDPGDDVLAVVGLTAALSFSATFDQIGVAQTPGRALVVRALSDSDERAMFERAFPDLTAAERASFYVARRRHRTTAVLLHELAHTLGAEHVADRDTLMSEAYSDRATAFDDRTHQIIAAALADRLRRGAPAPDAPHPTLVITIDAHGQRIIGGNAVDDATLDGLFQLSVSNDRETEIIVRGPGASGRAGAHVAARARAAGLSRISGSAAP
jgi:hypothetical protein